MVDTPLTQKLLETLQIEGSYTSQDIDRLIGKKAGYTSQRGGAVTSHGENFILLFVTLDKVATATQYVDHLENNILMWEGQTNQKFTESRMNSGSYQTMVFLRGTHHTPYTYYGRCVPVRQIRMPKGIPSKVVFCLYEWPYVDRTVVPVWRNQEREVPDYGPSPVLSQEPRYAVPALTEAERLETVRTKQTQYRNASLDFWHHRCAITGIDNPKILMASHIKPWRESSNEERVNPRNSLILTPLYDKLFDLGIVTFDTREQGRIVLSDQLTERDYARLGVSERDRLVTVPSGTDAFLDYHKTYIFDFENARQNDLELLTV